jgi:type II secretory pathway component PulF
MLLSTAVPLRDLTRFCRLARHGLAAGLSLVDVFRQQAERGPQSLRPIIAAVGERLARGDGLEDALKAEAGRLPPLFVTMTAVGEHTGNLPDTFAELERYYDLQWTLRRRFLAEITWPIFQFVMAVGVIALMLLVLGLIAGAGTAPLDPIGLGTGVRGAATWLLLVFGLVASAWGGYRLLAGSIRHKAAADRILLRVPVIGPCLEAMALARFCLGLRLTLGAGLPVKAAVKRSLDATGNAAYPARFDEAAAVLRRGDDLATMLKACAIFPQDFLDIVENAEEGGRTPEVMEKQAEYYQEESSLRLRVLMRMAGFGVWLAVAILLIVMIFRIFITAYLGPLEQIHREMGV